MPKKILIVEDEEDIVELVQYNLKQRGFDSQFVSSGDEAVKKAHSYAPDLILLDLMLPEVDGLDICRELKTDPETKHIPVIIMSAKSEESDIVIGLELGAEDYVTKPFSPKILIARIKSVLRRSTQENKPKIEGAIRVDTLEIIPEKMAVKVDGERVSLTLSEFQTLHLLAKQPGRVYTRYQIVEKVHGDDYAVTDRSIDVHIVNIRKKLKQYADLIETIRGVGYRFKDSE